MYQCNFHFHYHIYLCLLDRITKLWALDSLKNGNNFKNIIIDCYAQMLEVIKEEFNIERGISITPNEFMGFLIKRGLPYEPVYHITSLFEGIRYGSKQLNPNDEDEAIKSLKQIQLSLQSRK